MDLKDLNLDHSQSEKKLSAWWVFSSIYKWKKFVYAQRKLSQVSLSTSLLKSVRDVTILRVQKNICSQYYGAFIQNNVSSMQITSIGEMKKAASRIGSQSNGCLGNCPS